MIINDISENKGVRGCGYLLLTEIFEQINLIDDPNRIPCIELYNFFIKNCKDAKGSSHNHQNWNGGYFDHISEGLKYAKEIFPIISKRKLNFTFSDVVLVFCLHDIEKPLKYSNYNNQFKSDEEAKNFLLKEFKFELTDSHLNALKYIHGEGSDYKKDQRVMNELGAFCHCCDIISARIFYDYPKQK